MSRSVAFAWTFSVSPILLDVRPAGWGGVMTLIGYGLAVLFAVAWWFERKDRKWWHEQHGKACDIATGYRRAMFEALEAAVEGRERLYRTMQAIADNAVEAAKRDRAARVAQSTEEEG